MMTGVRWLTLAASGFRGSSRTRCASGRPRSASGSPSGRSAAHVRGWCSVRQLSCLSIALPAASAARGARPLAVVAPVPKRAPGTTRFIVATAVLLSITGIIAAWVPARRASRMEARSPCRKVSGKLHGGHVCGINRSRNR